VTVETPLDRFRTLLRIPTVSRADESTTEWHHFDRFLAALPELYPRVYRVLDREVIDGYSLLYRWHGVDDAAPTILMAHYDVVAATDDGWKFPPFDAVLDGEGDNQLLWGRGTLDDKGALVAVLEAVESLLESGFTPQSDIYLSFGHNEETAGSGARAIVDVLRARNIRPALVLDEGGAVVEGIFPGVDAPTAVVGVSEKGLLGLTLTVAQQGGHASAPPRITATVRLARAIVRLNSRPFTARLSPTNLEMVRTIGAAARQPFRALFTQTWLTKPLLIQIFGRLSAETSAMVRTTQVVTELSGSQAANAMAETARASVNIRIAVGSTMDQTIARVRRVIADPQVRIDVQHGSEPSPVSPTSGAAWERIRGAVLSTYPGTVVSPYIMLAASDGRHFTTISSCVYRFSPFEMSGEERGTLHAVNERISTRTFKRGIEFYRSLITAS
jgi:carboxypeptidase PM20D1